MEMLTGHGRPSKHLRGEVGQLYKNVDNGDLWQCKLANQYSTIHGAPVGGYLWVLHTKGEDTVYLLEDEEGNQVYATLVDDEETLTATVNDIREGAVAVTEAGLVVGEKEIPAYFTTEGVEVIPVGSEFEIVIRESDRYQYTKLQAILCPFNTSMADSVAADKVCINDSVYIAGKTDVLATVTLDDANKTIKLGITNDSANPFLIRYFSYKEEV